MNNTPAALAFPLLLAVTGFASSAGGGEFSAKIVDGLGRPVPGVAFDVHWLKHEATNDVRMELATAVSDAGGTVRGRYDEKSVPSGELVWAELSRKGYAAYTSTGLGTNYVLNREFHEADVPPITALCGRGTSVGGQGAVGGGFCIAEAESSRIAVFPRTTVACALARTGARSESGHSSQ